MGFCLCPPFRCTPLSLTQVLSAKNVTVDKCRYKVYLPAQSWSCIDCSNNPMTVSALKINKNSKNLNQAWKGHPSLPNHVAGPRDYGFSNFKQKVFELCGTHQCSFTKGWFPVLRKTHGETFILSTGPHGPIIPGWYCSVLRGLRDISAPEGGITLHRAVSTITHGWSSYSLGEFWFLWAFSISQNVFL